MVPSQEDHKEGFYTPHPRPSTLRFRSHRPRAWPVGGTSWQLCATKYLVSSSHLLVRLPASPSWINNNKAYTLTLSQRAGGRQREASFHKGLLCARWGLRCDFCPPTSGVPGSASWDQYDQTPPSRAASSPKACGLHGCRVVCFLNPCHRTQPRAWCLISIG